MIKTITLSVLLASTAIAYGTDLPPLTVHDAVAGGIPWNHLHASLYNNHAYHGCSQGLSKVKCPPQKKPQAPKKAKTVKKHNESEVIAQHKPTLSVNVPTLIPINFSLQSAFPFTNKEFYINIRSITFTKNFDATTHQCNGDDQKVLLISTTQYVDGGFTLTGKLGTKIGTSLINKNFIARVAQDYLHIKLGKGGYTCVAFQQYYKNGQPHGGTNQHPIEKPGKYDVYTINPHTNQINAPLVLNNIQVQGEVTYHHHSIPNITTADIYNQNLNILNKGTLQFLSDKGQPISTLRLNRGQTTTITLKNTGAGPIQNLQITYEPSSFSSYFTKTCNTILNSNHDCTITYHSTGRTGGGNIHITANNSSQPAWRLPFSISASGKLMCWGHNNRGQLGDGTHTNSNRPIAVQGLSDHVKKAASSDRATCALLDSGTVKCWGNIPGDSFNASDVLHPQTVDNIDNAIDISMGVRHACALLATGQVKCWGDNDSGQLGNNSHLSYSKDAVAVMDDNAGNELSNVISINANKTSTCALLNSGIVKCWGSNFNNSLGNTGISSSNIPIVVPGLTANVVKIAGKSFDSCALMQDGKMRCWGSNLLGQTGEKGTVGATTVIPKPNQYIVNPVDFGIDAMNSCGLMANGTIQCTEPQSVGGKRFISVQTFNNIHSAVSIKENFANFCTLLSSGKVKCWGENYFGQIGDGTYNAVYGSPKEVLGVANALSISVGDRMACAIVQNKTP